MQKFSINYIFMFGKKMLIFLVCAVAELPFGLLSTVTVSSHFSKRFTGNNKCEPLPIENNPILFEIQYSFFWKLAESLPEIIFLCLSLFLNMST